ncbi:CBS domain-containing protein [Aeromicrobium sp.]|uniref:CBS domain-containing protein n=1 Tax=Aeromicrobium sp. TaxID=1871063 RepID=UPI0030BA3177
MLRQPKTLSADVSIGEARAAFSDDHMHMVLLTEGRALVGTLTRSDLPQADDLDPALNWSKLVGRTVSPDASTVAVHALLMDQGVRRVAVVAVDGSLLGLVCLKQRRTGFCSDVDIESRSPSHHGKTSQLAGDVLHILQGPKSLAQVADANESGQFRMPTRRSGRRIDERATRAEEIADSHDEAPAGDCPGSGERSER